MIMCHLRYRKMSVADFGSWQEWVACVNENIRYCRLLPVHRVREFRFKCKSYELPSFHPHWAMRVCRSNVDQRRAIQKRYEVCKKDPNMIKVLFNASTTLVIIRKQIDGFPSRRQEWACTKSIPGR